MSSRRPSTSPRPRAALAGPALVAVLLLLAAACGSDDAIGTDAVPTTPTTATTGTGSGTVVDADDQTTTTATEVTTTATAATTGQELTGWLGAYRWSESAEGLSGVNQTIGHDLLLDTTTAGGTALQGRLDQNGFQTSRSIPIEATLADGELVVEATESIQLVESGQVLLRLEGTPEAPLTGLGAMPLLIEDRGRRGVYFVPSGSRSPAPVPVPEDVWVVEEATFDLVRLATATGQPLDRITGWGPDAATAGEGGGQALQTVEVAGDGRLWVTDCCEPAVGNVYVFRPGTSTDLESAEHRLNGLGPKVAPDGALAALSVLDLGVAIIDASTGVAIEEAGLLEGLVAQPDTGGSSPGVVWPVAWTGADILTVAVVDGESSILSFVDLSDPRSPRSAGPSLTLPGDVIDGAAGPDGFVAALVRPFGGPARDLVLVDPRAGTIADRFGIGDNVIAVDYSPDGHSLLQVHATGALEALGDPGALSPLPGGYVDGGW